RASAPGRVDVDSKRALHQLGRADLPQHLQLRREQVRFFERHAELCVGDKNVRMAGNSRQRSNILAQPFSGELADQSYLESLKHRALGMNRLQSSIRCGRLNV